MYFIVFDAKPKKLFLVSSASRAPELVGGREGQDCDCGIGLMDTPSST
jgi:hypothetical protein